PPPPEGAFFDLYEVFSASVDVHSCEEYAFQSVWEYHRWRRYPPGLLFLAAYAGPVDEGAIGRRGLLVEGTPPTLRKAVRTLSERWDVIPPPHVWAPAELGDPMGYTKSGWFGLGSSALTEAVARLGGDYLWLALLSQ